MKYTQEDTPLSTEMEFRDEGVKLWKSMIKYTEWIYQLIFYSCFSIW
jgi:hypothetical protein